MRKGPTLFVRDVTARGILDLDAWLREFSVMPGFWSLLLERATALDLQWPLHHTLRYAQAILGMPVRCKPWPHWSPA